MGACASSADRFKVEVHNPNNEWKVMDGKILTWNNEHMSRDNKSTITAKWLRIAVLYKPKSDHPFAFQEIYGTENGKEEARFDQYAVWTKIISKPTETEHGMQYTAQNYNADRTETVIIAPYASIFISFDKIAKGQSGMATAVAIENGDNEDVKEYPDTVKLHPNRGLHSYGDKLIYTVYDKQYDDRVFNKIIEYNPRIEPQLKYGYYHKFREYGDIMTKQSQYTVCVDQANHKLYKLDVDNFMIYDMETRSWDHKNKVKFMLTHGKDDIFRNAKKLTLIPSNTKNNVYLQFYFQRYNFSSSLYELYNLRVNLKMKDVQVIRDKELEAVTTTGSYEVRGELKPVSRGFVPPNPFVMTQSKNLWEFLYCEVFHRLYLFAAMQRGIKVMYKDIGLSTEWVDCMNIEELSWKHEGDIRVVLVDDYMVLLMYFDQSKITNSELYCVNLLDMTIKKDKRLLDYSYNYVAKEAICYNEVHRKVYFANEYVTDSLDVDECEWIISPETRMMILSGFLRNYTQSYDIVFPHSLVMICRQFYSS